MSTEPANVTANGVDFAYLEEGEGPLCLLLHGFPDTAHSWDEVRPALAQAGWRVVTPFMRGYYPSEVPRDGKYDSDTLGADVLALIDALGERKAVVVGHDWGASAAYSAAGLSPESLNLLVTVAIPQPAGVIPTPRVLWSIRHFVTLRLPNAEANVRANNFALVDELVQRWSPAWAVPAGETDAVKAAFREPGCLAAALGYYRAIGLRVPPAQRRKVRCPAVAFAGTDDLIAPTAFERARSRYADRYEVVNMPGGHFMHREHPERFIRELKRVLEPARPSDAQG